MLLTHLLLAEDRDEDISKKSAENLRITENLHEKTAKIINEGRSRDVFKKTKVGARTIASKPIVIILIIAALVVIVSLLYTQIQVGNESYKIENYEALWNQSLADFRSGNTTIVEYCTKRVHDEDFCNRFSSLQYLN